MLLGNSANAEGMYAIQMMRKTKKLARVKPSFLTMISPSESLMGFVFDSYLAIGSVVTD